MKLLAFLKQNLDLDAYTVLSDPLKPGKIEQHFSSELAGTIQINFTNKEVYFTPPAYITAIKFNKPAKEVDMIIQTFIVNQARVNNPNVNWGFEAILAWADFSRNYDVRKYVNKRRRLIDPIVITDHAHPSDPPLRTYTESEVTALLAAAPAPFRGLTPAKFGDIIRGGTALALQGLVEVLKFTWNTGVKIVDVGLDGAGAIVSLAKAVAAIPAAYNRTLDSLPMIAFIAVILLVYKVAPSSK